MLVNRNGEAICSETAVLGMMLDGFVNLAVSTAPRIGYFGVMAQIIQNPPALAIGGGSEQH